VICAAGVAAAQPDTPAITIRGRVIDPLGKGIAGATISVEALPDIAPGTSDPRGYYVLHDVPVGVGLVFSAEGYEPGLGVVVGPVVDDVVLVSEAMAAEVITVQGEAPAAAPGAARLGREDLERLPGTGNDLVRSLSAMPGVANFQLPLGTSGVAIRGASPQDSKILLDDFEIPRLYHDIAFRSIVPEETIDKLEYVPGGFDVGYGRASSGIVNVTSRAGSDKRSEQIEAGSIDAGFVMQGPAGKNTRYMIAFRRTLVDLYFASLIPDDADLSLTTVPRYYDEQLRIDHVVNSRWSLRFTSVGSDDELGLFSDRAMNADKRFYNRNRFLRLTGAATYNAGHWHGQLALSGIAQQLILEQGVTQFIDARQPTVTARGELSRTAEYAGGLTDVTWRLGAEANVGRATIDLAIPQERREGQPPRAEDPDDTSQQFHGTFWTPDFAAWTAVHASLDPRIRFTGGLRLDIFGRNDDYALEPRGELQWKLTPKLSARLSSGLYVRPPEYQTELLYAGAHGERALQTIAGLQYEPRDGVRIQTSAYYIDRTKLLAYAPDGMSLTNDARGTTMGAELLAIMRRGPWFGFLSYTYSHSTRRDSPHSSERLFDYDQPHNLNVALSWTHGKWTFGGRFELYSGLPTTPVQLAVFDSDRNSYTPIFGDVNSERAPIHHQLDLRMDRRYKLGPVNMSYFLDVQNVYVNQSTIAYFYNFDYTTRASFKALPIIPSAGLRGTW
jgi:hypothetical protein